jgi:proteasome accessory factor C
MSQSAAGQLRRILHLIPTIADGREHSLSDVAAQLGVDVPTLRRDLLSIAERFNEPGGFVDPVQVYLEPDRVSLVSNEFLRPMRLTTSELCALELGLAMLRTERPDEASVIESARARLREVITKLPSWPDTADLYQATIGPVAVNPEHLAVVRRAYQQRRKLFLTYRGSKDTEPEGRVIAPYAVVATNGMFYVVACCERNEGIRIFRLDRVEGAELMQDRFSIPEDFSVSGVLHSGKALGSEAVEEVRIRYSPQIARWIAEREGAPVDADGSVTVAHPLLDPAWAVRHVLQYGPEAEVLAPARVKELVRERLAAMAAAVAPLTK